MRQAKMAIIGLGLLIILSGCSVIVPEKNTDNIEQSPELIQIDETAASKNQLQVENAKEQTIDDSAIEVKEDSKGLAKLKFINKITGKSVPGHVIYCSGCASPSVSSPAETDINGEVSVDLGSTKIFNISKLRTDWYNYDIVKDLKPGETKIIEMMPQAVNEGNRIFFPTTTAIKNPNNKIQLTIIYKDSTGTTQKGKSIALTGPINDNKRVSVVGTTDQLGKTTVVLPISGAYRISFTSKNGSTDFFQIDAPTDYNITLDLDLSKLDKMINGTTALSKNYLARGMILVCTRERGTNKPVYTSINIPSSNSIFSSSVRYEQDICVEVPSSYKEVYAPANGIHNGSAVTSTSGANDKGILYLYVELKK